MKLFERTAASLEQDLPGFIGPFLPSAEQLCARYDVCRLTLLRAARVLADKGLLDISRGRRIVKLNVAVGAAAVTTPEPPGSGPEALSRDLRELVSSGVLKAGRQLPKSTFLMSKYRVCSRTLARCLRTLQAEGLAHKKGRQWVAGSEWKGARAPRAGKYVVFFLQEELMTPPSMFGERSSRFFQSFSDEAYGRDLMILPLVASTGIPSSGTSWGGGKSMERTIRDVGDRYLGTLMAGSKRQFPHIEELRRRLVSFEKPVVWFDRFDETAGAQKTGDRRFTRCYFRESLGVQRAIEYLDRAGHDSIGFLGHQDVPWVHNRAALVQQVAAAIAPGMSVRVINVSSGQDQTGTDDMPVPRGRSEGDRRMLQRIEELIREGVSAIVAADDFAAQRVYGLCTVAGIRIPETVSLISFDNVTLRFPVTSVDFGFGYLGYAAFHAILGDIPLRRDRNGDIAANPRVIDKGTMKKLC